MTKEILGRIPDLEEGPDDRFHVKFFTQWSSRTWYAQEYSPVEKLFYGLVDGIEAEYGYFSLAELEEIKGPVGLKIEKDLHFDGLHSGQCHDWCESTDVLGQGDLLPNNPDTKI